MSNDLIQPPMIRYNLKERGRQYRGVERDFDIPAIVAAINSPACQERVKTRGMLGFLGHWVRIRFGLEPSEGGIAQGKAQAIEPAIVTTYLKAYPNGDIEHKTEFLNTKTGRIAARMFDSKVGGFSSAIDENNPTFYGFDWVNDPNYSTNRGYGIALDSASTMSIGDLMAAEMQDQAEAMDILLRASEYREKLALDSASALRIENEQIYSMMLEMQESMKVNVKPKGHMASQMMRDKATFDSTLVLPFPVEKDEKSKASDVKANTEYNMLKRMVIRNV